MKIALAQTNPTVGDLAANAALLRRNLHAARDAGAGLIVFPELSIIGYPPKDLLLKPSVIDDCRAAVEQLAAECTGIAAIIGLPVWSTKPDGRTLHNAAAVCFGGCIQSLHLKSLLPTYDVFDEQRYFEPGPRIDLTYLPRPNTTTDAAAEAADPPTLSLGISICEDLWGAAEHSDRRIYHDNPIDELAAAGAKLFINTSASPFVLGKHAKRLDIIRDLAKHHRVPVLFCNQVGGNDELVFDGNSCVIDAQGNLVAHAKSFDEDLLFVDLHPPQTHSTAPPKITAALPTASPSPSSPKPGASRSDAPGSLPAPAPCPCADVHAALVLGLRDYTRKCGFGSVVLGLSGGIDSAVTAAVAVAALGADKVRGVAMPSRYSSPGSVDDARKLADNLGIAFHTVPIEPPHAAMEQTLQPTFDELLGHNNTPGVTEENIQARLRGVILMAFSNKLGAMLVTTGNKSELAVGYCTLYGDMAGGFSVLSDIPKTLVYELARWINDAEDSPLRRQLENAVIPEDTITKPPSAELRPDQKDQDSLPPYDVLDDIIERYVERDQPDHQIIADAGHDSDTVRRIIALIDRNEYKRKQAAPGLKITSRAFGFGRRMPIAQRYDAQAVHPHA